MQRTLICVSHCDGADGAEEDSTRYDLVVNTGALSPGEPASIVAHAAG